MLSGDSRATAERIAAELGIDEVIAEVLPPDEAAKVEQLKSEGRRVAMVGDGVNNAPALAHADVGIAIGAGTGLAVETGDVVLMRSDPLDIATAIARGRTSLRVQADSRRRVPTGSIEKCPFNMSTFSRGLRVLEGMIAKGKQHGVGFVTARAADD
jgi:haloacid dehalogenase-like hydrolase